MTLVLQSSQLLKSLEWFQSLITYERHLEKQLAPVPQFELTDFGSLQDDY